MFINIFFQYRYESPSTGVRIADPLYNLLGSKPRSVLLENHHTERALKIRIPYGISVWYFFIAIASLKKRLKIPQLKCSSLLCPTQYAVIQFYRHEE